MKLENQVTSLALSQRLKELGVKQESYFYHCPWSSQEPAILTRKELGEDFLQSGIDGHTYSALTVAELGKRLEKAAYDDFIMAYCETMAFNDEIFSAVDTAQHMHNVMTDPDIAAGMLIYLLENGLITI